LVGLALYFRTQRFYKQVVIRKLNYYARWRRMCLPAFWHKGLSIKENMSYELYLLCVFKFEKDMYSIILSIIICHCCLWLWAYFFHFSDNIIVLWTCISLSSYYTRNI
jgi:hypothetical protein